MLILTIGSKTGSILSPKFLNVDSELSHLLLGVAGVKCATLALTFFICADMYLARIVMETMPSMETIITLIININILLLS